MKPNTRPRYRGPVRSIFMLTVMDQASPWLTPNNRFAAMIQPQSGAQINSSGTGMPIIQPAMAIRMRRRVNRWARGPTSRLEAA
ncbi:MAG: hypothetical protein CL747_02105 [Chloroflexi bacterium]|nr:hypothetical protein [Chloroflexota bacterium]